jgi:hypothetical protein
MHSAHDLMTRWPALDVAARRARLEKTLQHFPGGDRALTDALADEADKVGRALAGLWSREPIVWSRDPDVQVKVLRVVTDLLLERSART